MSRFTITNLRALVDEANERYPRETPNYYGNLKRFCISGAYGGWQIQEHYEDTSAVRQITYGYVSARECAEQFRAYLWRNF